MNPWLFALWLSTLLTVVGLEPLRAETVPGGDKPISLSPGLPMTGEPTRTSDPVLSVREAAANSILTSLAVAVLTYSLSLVHAFGVLYFGPWTRRILQFTLRTLLCVSPMVLLLVIHSAQNDIGLLIVFSMAIAVYPLTAGLLLNRIHDAAPDFHFLQAKILGHGPIGVFFDYAWPRFLPLTLPFFFLGFIHSLLVESMFSSLGLVSFPLGDTWGSLIHHGLDELLDRPWAVFAPGLAILGTAFATYACIPLFEKLLSVPTELT
jgi:ABC-type dipeptide/oligopeptide/nickel transport system permease subunit